MGASAAAVSLLRAFGECSRYTCRAGYCLFFSPWHCVAYISGKLQDLTAGSFAGAASLVVGHPFDTIKASS